MNYCLYCKSILEGRSDKKFCDAYCKSSFHYQSSKLKEETIYVKIDKQLKTNRRLLKHFNRSGYASIDVQDLNDLGFNPKYFTHYWKNKKGDIYLFCYEYGFIKKTLNFKKKYILVIWQKYMEEK